MTGVSFAQGGHDGEKDGKMDGNTVQKDSTVDTNSHGNESDDTLVLEPWIDIRLDGDGGSGIEGEQFQETPISHGISKNQSHGNLGSGTRSENYFERNWNVEVTLYPNPTVDELHLKSSTIPNNLRITDITGKQHLFTEYTSQVDVALLPPGTYFVQLIFDGHIEARKFIKS